jgi:hypothetical protein
MTTIIINERSADAKKMVELLKTQRYVTIVEEKKPSPSLLKAMNEAKTGKVTHTKSVSDVFEKLKS